MTLTGQQRLALQEALLGAFPRRSDLEQMLLHYADKHLNRLAPEGSQSEVIFSLIKNAEAEGWVGTLIASACIAVPGNEKLRNIALTIPFVPPPSIPKAELPPNNLPPRRRFFGREGELEAIGGALHGAGPAGGRSILTLFGIGGIGKTALALAYAYRFAPRYPGGIWWVSASGDLCEALLRLRDDLCFVATDSFPPFLGELHRGFPVEEMAKRIKLALQMRRAPSLLVLDDVDRRDWESAIPGGEVRVLITTRDRLLGQSKGDIKLVDRLSLERALELAYDIAGPPQSEREMRACRRALANLDGLPIAVEAASQAVTDATFSWTECERRLRPGDALVESADTQDHSRIVFASLDRSIDVCRPGSSARVLLEAVAWFAPDGAPLDWATQTAGLTESSAHEEAARATLGRLGLIRLDAGRKTIALHPLVHQRMRMITPPETQDRLARQGVTVIAEWLRQVVDPRRMNEVDARRPHIDRALALCEKQGDEPGWLSIAPWLALHLYHRESLAESKALLMKAQLRLEARQPEAQGALIDVLSTLGMVESDLGEPLDALPLFERARALAEELHGPDHRKHATQLANLAMTFRALDRSGTALPLLRRALAILEPQSGTERNRLALVHACLGAVLHDLGAAGDALHHFDRSLTIRPQVEEDDDPKTAMILAGLAPVLFDLRAPDRARDVATRALEVIERVYGPDHPRLQRLQARLEGVAPPAHTRRPTRPLQTTINTDPRALPASPARTSVATILFSPEIRAEAAPRQRFAAKLTIVEGPRTGKQIILSEQSFALGRGLRAQCKLADDTVSIHHASISWTGSAYALTDLGSASGTFVNDLSIHHRELLSGDLIRIGKTVFRFVSEGPERRSTPTPSRSAYLESIVGNDAAGTPLGISTFPLTFDEITVGTSAKCDLQIPEGCNVSRRHAKLTRHGSTYLLEDTFSRDGVWLNNSRIERALLRSGDLISFGLLRFRYVSDEHLLSLRPSAETPLRDAAALEQRLDELARKASLAEPRSLIVLELDLAGVDQAHAAAARRQIASLMEARAPTEDGDTLARLDDARFALLLERTSLELGRGVAEALRLVIESWPVLGLPSTSTVTASLGVVTLDPASRTSPPSALALALEHLRLAQQAGGNRVVARLAP